MEIKPISPQPTFVGYQSILKTQWKKGNLPTVKRGLYGGLLTMDTVSIEHIVPKSQGGKSILSNYALTTKIKNNIRDNKPLADFLNWDMVNRYLDQFLGIKIEGFDGDKYAKSIRKTLSTLI